MTPVRSVTHACLIALRKAYAAVAEATKNEEIKHNALQAARRRRKSEALCTNERAEWAKAKREVAGAMQKWNSAAEIVALDYCESIGFDLDGESLEGDLAASLAAGGVR